MDFSAESLPIAAAADAAPRLMYLFPGIQGGPWILSLARKAMVGGGIVADIRVFDWQRLDTLSNLTDLTRNRLAARRIACEIAAYCEAHPAATIDLLGYSGGGGMAIFVAEQLPPAVRLRSIILIHAALAPDYDLTRALTHCDGRLLSFYSDLDWAVLGVGTELFGTMDRKFVQSAGRVGFDLARAIPNETLRRHVHQVRWTPEMMNDGHWGGHVPIHFYAWNRRYIVPELLNEWPQP